MMIWGIHARGRRGHRACLAPLLSPGADMWTYGFNPEDIPMGYGKPNKGVCRKLGQYGQVFSRSDSAIITG